jgi:hypothetical protein
MSFVEMSFVEMSFVEMSFVKMSFVEIDKKLNNCPISKNPYLT